ncbi:MAG: hypothetical protein ACYTGL_19295 [Planctomycetota bacterium]|jgi:hypothetical protein
MIDAIRDTARNLRATVERARDADADIPWLSRFPKDCCNFGSNLLLFALSDAGVKRLRRVMGTVPEEGPDSDTRHVWVQADDYTVDICADQFGQSAVIAEQQSNWHDAMLDVKPFLAHCDIPEGISDTEIARLREIYEDVLAELARFR